MKSIKRIVAVVVACIAIAVPASAQFSFGVKAGAKINDLSIDEKVFSADNQAGFTGGVMAEFTLPVLGIGLDASVMYVYNKFKGVSVDGTEVETISKSRDYIEIPVNLKWKFGLPIAGKIVTPMLFTGPSFSFLTSSSIIEDYKQEKFDVAWNLGIGVELFNKVQIAGSYGWGLNNTLQYLNEDGKYIDIPGKKNCWTITAAYLF